MQRETLKGHRVSIHELWNFFESVFECYTEFRNIRIQIKLCFPEIIPAKTLQFRCKTGFVYFKNFFNYSYVTYPNI